MLYYCFRTTLKKISSMHAIQILLCCHFVMLFSLQLPVIHVVGNLLWSHNVFMHQNLPYLKKVVDRKQLHHPAESIKLYLSDRGPNLPRQDIESVEETEE